MGVDLRTDTSGYWDVCDHYGHMIDIALWGGDEATNAHAVTIHCETCQEVLVAFEAPACPSCEVHNIRWDACENCGWSARLDGGGEHENS